MESVRSNLRYEWKKYLMALWMIGITTFVVSMDMKVRHLVTRVQNIDATMDSIEGIVSGSDYTLGNIEKKVGDICISCSSNFHSTWFASFVSFHSKDRSICLGDPSRRFGRHVGLCGCVSSASSG